MVLGSRHPAGLQTRTLGTATSATILPGMACPRQLPAPAGAPYHRGWKGLRLLLRCAGRSLRRGAMTIGQGQWVCRTGLRPPRRLILGR